MKQTKYRTFCKNGVDLNLRIEALGNLTDELISFISNI